MVRQNPFSRTAIFMLTLSGVWPGALSALFWRTFLIVSMLIANSCHYRYFMYHLHSATFLEFMDCLSVVLAHCKVVFKCTMFWFNQRKFIEALTIMREDWNDCANDEISMSKTASKAKTSERITNIILILHTLAVSFLGFFTLIQNDFDITNTTEISFITKIEVPFDVNTQRTYRCILMIELSFLYMFAWSAGIMNALILFLTCHTAGQIDIVRYWLTQLATSKNESESDSIGVAMTKIIQKHNKIILLTEKIEGLYTHIALMLFMLNSIMICVLAFFIVTAIGSPNAAEQIMRSLFFYIITNLETYIFCFAGEYLQNKGKEIGYAAYDSAWPDMASKDSRILLFIIQRSQKQLTLTAGKMIELSLKSFTSIMNASGSYLSMLLAMQ